MSDETTQDVQTARNECDVMFKPASWRKKIEFIKRLVLDQNVLISILGEEQSGKTTFAALLKTSLPVKIKGSIISARPAFEKQGFIEELSVLIGTSKESSLSALVSHVNDQKMKVLVLIDDAHFLPDHFIEELLVEIEKQGQQGYFHVCLISDFSLVSLLNTFAKGSFKERIHSIEMGPLSAAETKAFVVHHLLPIQGADKKVSETRLKRFYQMTGGHLVHVNRQLNHFFNESEPKNINIKSSLLLRPTIAAGIFLALVAAAYFLQPQILGALPRHLGASANVPELVLASYVASYDNKAERQVVVVTTMRRAELEGIQEEQDLPSESMAVIDKVVVAPKILQAEVGPTIIPSLNSKSVKKVSVQRAVLNHDTYTIQLLASHNKHELYRFVQTHHLEGKIRIHRTALAGKDWYVLTLGEYKAPQYAKQALNHLPKNIEKFKPWVRAVAGIKEAG